MKGYKVFNSDWTCRGMQYEVGKSYEMEESPIICVRGFHFCEKAADCFEYYRFTSENKVAEVEAYGELEFEKNGNKHCTNKIKIIRELNWHEVLNLVNAGKDCTGKRNTGNRNTGDKNTGNWNTGDGNAGNGNTGSGNTGNWNTGDWNLASNCAGCFNTIDKPIMFFDKPSNITLEEWRNSDACWLLNKINFRPTDWIWSADMTNAEKEQHPEHKVTGGYLKIRDNRDCCIEWWAGLTNREKAIIKAIPNFDSEKFYRITGIKVE